MYRGWIGSWLHGGFRAKLYGSQNKSSVCSLKFPNDWPSKITIWDSHIFTEAKMSHGRMANGKCGSNEIRLFKRYLLLLWQIHWSFFFLLSFSPFAFEVYSFDVEHDFKVPSEIPFKHQFSFIFKAEDFPKKCNFLVSMFLWYLRLFPIF